MPFLPFRYSVSKKSKEGPSQPKRDRPAGIADEPGLSKGENISPIGAVELGQKQERDFFIERFFKQAKERRREKAGQQTAKGAGQGPDVFARHYGSAKIKDFSKQLAQKHLEVFSGPKYKVERYRLKKQLQQGRSDKVLEGYFPKSKDKLKHQKAFKHKLIPARIKALKKELTRGSTSLTRKEVIRKQIKALEPFAKRRKQQYQYANSKKPGVVSAPEKRKTFSSFLQGLRAKKAA